MMEIHELPEREKEKIKVKLRKALMGRSEVLFAYLHGSFLEEGPFRDIDVAVYVRGPTEKFYEETLEEELSRIVGVSRGRQNPEQCPCKVQIQGHRGELLFSKDEKLRCEFEERTMAEYHDYSYYIDLYRRETLGI
ncbi:nucleotidyltransferase domain-containing protein [Thermococcus sp.]|uniref:nucleotidyltransferase domain-containing protein n=1 Tax=Thermococcus sp. TaxID=35749 RepID=UPI002601E59A|nr:nucleotidyltransferase domain-containing protein [Thermococcus sp.]